MLRKMITILMVFMLSFGAALNASAWGDEGKPTSAYKWSYDYKDGYVADRADYFWKNNEDSSTGKEQPSPPNIYRDTFDINNRNLSWDDHFRGDHSN